MLLGSWKRLGTSELMIVSAQTLWLKRLLMNTLTSLLPSDSRPSRQAPQVPIAFLA